jgi:hypothetical protein
MITKIKAFLISFGYRESEHNMFIKPVGFVGYVAKIDGERLFLKTVLKNNNDNDLIVWGSREIDIREFTEMEMEDAQRFFAEIESAIFTNSMGYGTFNWITPVELLTLQM